MRGVRRRPRPAGMNDSRAKPVSPLDEPVVLAREPLEELRQMEAEGDRHFVWSLVQDFIREVAIRIASMEVAAEGGDRVTLEHLAHSLKGSAGMIGGHRFAARCCVVELAAAEADPGPLPPGMLAEVRAEFEALRAELLRAVPAPRGSSGALP